MADAALRLVLIYAVFAGLWILLSDKAVAWLVHDPEQNAVVSTMKGWVFVAVTAALLYGLITRLLKQVETSTQRELDALTEAAFAKRLLDDIADRSPDAIFAKDLAGRYLFLNREMARVVGKTPEQVIGGDDTCLFTSAQAEMLRRNDQRAMAEPQVDHFEETLRTVDGERIFEAIKGPLHDEGGQVIGVFGIARNITDRKHAEAAWLERDFKLSAIVNHSPSALSLKHPDGRYAQANPNLQRIHHLTEEDIIGKTDFDLYPAEIARCLRANDEVVLRTQARHSIEESIPVDGQARTFMSHMFPVLGATGTIRFICRISLDITERKLHEDRLKTAMVDVERANNAKSRFLAAASHDLRQPLSALSLYLNVLKDKVAPSERPLLANMKDCMGSLSGLLTDLLDLSKLEAGVIQPSVRDFPIGATLARQEAIHTPEASLKGLQLRCPPCQLTVRTDPVLFERMLSNLIDNAIRYTERGGVLVASRRRHGKTWLEIWDTGMGIPADKTIEIFEEFKQLDDGARNRGSGLGLAIVAKTATLLGLEIQVQSRPGRGSVFAIELPLGQLQEEASVSKEHQALCRSLRIALVEDNTMVRNALIGALVSVGHHVIAAATGQELRAVLDGPKPDIVVSDYRLADGETGFDVISGLRAIVGLDLPAILITGDTDPMLMRSMANRGIVVVHKPVDLETLQAYLEDLTQPLQEGRET